MLVDVDFAAHQGAFAKDWYGVYGVDFEAEHIGTGMYSGIPMLDYDYPTLIKYTYPSTECFWGMEVEDRLEKLRESFQNGTYFSDIGVCDYPEQLFEKYPVIKTDPRPFIIMFDEKNRGIVESMGWRWHKQGEYIGTQKPIHEYFDDDKHIDRVYFFHVYEVNQ